MKRLLSLFIVAMLATLAFANAWTPQTLPVPGNTTDPNKVSYVSNPDGILTKAEVDSINAIMKLLEAQHGVRGLIIAIKEMDPDDPYEFTIGVGREHGIGGKSSTGFIIMVSTVSRGYEIMPGEGMEKFLTDGQCSTIGRHDMVPLLKEERWGEGILAALHTIQGVCNGEEELIPEEDDEDEDIWYAIGLFIIIFCVVVFIGYQSNKCPKCRKQNTYKLYLRQTVLAPGEPGAPSDEEVEERLHAQLAKMPGSEGKSILKPELEISRAEIDTILTIAQQEATTENAHRKTFSDNRKVRVIDVYRCSACGYVHRQEKRDTTYNYKLGLFTAGSFGVIAHAASSGSGGSGGFGGGFGGGSSSGGSSHSWGSSGGGSFGGGGAGGRF